MTKTLLSLDASTLNYAKIALQDIQNGTKKAIQNAINQTLTESRRSFYNAIKQEYSLQKTKSQEKEAIRVQRASPDRLYGMLHYRSASLPLINFSVKPRNVPMQKSRRIKQRKKIVTEVIRGRATTWNHAFLAKMKSGHIGVFERVTNRRLPIRQKYSTSIPQMIESLLIRDPALAARIEQIADRKLNQQVEKILAKNSK